MVKNNIKPYIVQGIAVMSITVFCLLSYLLVLSNKVAESKLEDDYIYVSKEILTNNITPVLKEETENKTVIEKPFNQEDVKIAKSFYDYQGEKKEQEQSITLYENTYIQNTGVDYISDNPFHIHSILDGKVISITNDDIVGTTIKIEHSNGIISTYQSLSDILVKENEEVEQGQILGSSGKNSYNSDMENHLHFELYYKDKLVNPEEYYGKTLGE